METAGGELLIEEYGPLCKKIRVLHVAEKVGEVDTYLKMLFRYSDSSRVENILVCSEAYDTRDYYGVADSVEQIHMEHDISMSENGRTVRKLREIIERYSPDIVYAHSYRSGILLRIADLGIRNRVAYNPHGWLFNRRIDSGKRRKMTAAEKILILFTDLVICGSEAEKNYAIKHTIVPEKKIRVITTPHLNASQESWTAAMRSDGKRMAEDTEELYEKILWNGS